MGVALGEFYPICEIESTLGMPSSKTLDIKGWEEKFEVISPKNDELECSSVYLEEFDLGEEEKIYQISCFVINAEIYSQYFQHHIDSYESSFT